ncbi:hypothetical protein RCC89_09495 [Cytophagaceae bacterium ABcell3]|nr:hypothetical protein RCC89_09495 [Cytophagaceae bacterium ABcell3]
MILLLCGFLASCHKETAEIEDIVVKLDGRWNIERMTYAKLGDERKVEHVVLSPEDYIDFNDSTFDVVKYVGGDLRYGSFASVNDVAVKIHMFGDADADVYVVRFISPNACELESTRRGDEYDINKKIKLYR